MKKFLATILAVMMILTVIPAFAVIPAMSITAETVEIQEGTETVSVKLTLSNNPGIAVVAFKVDYNSEALTLTEVSEGVIYTGDGFDPGNIAAKPYVFSQFTGRSNKTDNGLIATLKFDVNSDCKPGDYAITLIPDGDMLNIDEAAVPCTLVNGKVKVTEKPKENMALTFSNKTVTYNKAEQAITVAGTIPAGAEVSYTNNKATNAGTYNASVKVTADGYNDFTANAVLKIEEQPVTVTGLTAKDKIYDGKTDAVLSGGTLSGVISSDDVIAAMPTSGTFAKTTVGTNIAVQAPTITLTGTAAANYKLTQPTGLKANITAAPITVTAKSYQIVKGMDIPKLDYEITEGALVDDDKLSGELATTAVNTRVSTYPITQGTLTAGSNYKLTFINGSIQVVDKKTQNIAVSTITDKTYGDASFNVTVTPDATSGLTAITYTSSNPNVAEISNSGVVTIKNAGTTTITVKQAGNDTYAEFTKAQTLEVSKVSIKVTAKSYEIVKGMDIPRLDYDITEGALVGDDKFSGKLATTAVNTRIGTYSITQGALTAGSNYKLTFVNGSIKVVDKKTQNIAVSTITDKTYGDASFNVTVTPDATSGLTAITYTSSNPNVAEISNTGVVTIKNAGTTTITVKQAGDDTYAEFTKAQTLNVSKVSVKVTAKSYQIVKGMDIPKLGYDITEGTLVGDDILSGELATTAVNTRIGTYSITQGALTAGTNYNLTFINGSIQVVDKKTQNIAVSTISGKTYGDASFTVTVTPDSTSGLVAITYTSSNPNVAEISNSGVVTIKNAGTTTITVKQAGSDTYAEFTKAQTLNVSKVSIKVTAKSYQIVKGMDIPELGYDITEGALVGEDTFTGELATTAVNTRLGKYNITKGTLSAGENYNMTFEGGKLEVLDKTPQTIAVDRITDKTYGDGSFTVGVTPDSTSGLTAFTYTSSDSNVAEISNTGVVTIKNAGDTTITVSQAGDDTYAPFTKEQVLHVSKLLVTVTANSSGKKVDSMDPAELTYTSDRELIGSDTFTGKLVRAAGEAVGTYDILMGTLALNDNYELVYNKATFTIFDKTPQNITVTPISSANYGVGSIQITVTPDASTGLTDFTFESSNTDVAVVSASGLMTVKGVGTTTITVKQAGNADYAAFSKEFVFTAGKAVAQITEIDLDEKTYSLVGVVADDISNVWLDFSNVKLTKLSDADADTENVRATGFELKGTKAGSYYLSATSIDTTIKKVNSVEVDVAETKGTIEGTGLYIKGASITLSATANSGYKFGGWYVEDELVSSDREYTFVLYEDKDVVAKFTKKASSSLPDYYTVKFDTNGGNTMKSLYVARNAIIGELDEPVKKGYTFKGWYKDSKFTTLFTEDDRVISEMTLYAKWDKGESDNSKNQIILTIGKKNASVFGKTQKNDVAPLIREDRTMLPARFVAEALGAEVSWNEDEQEVTITKDEIEIVITIGKDRAVVNGKKVVLDSPAFIENDRTYTPIRFISEALGAEVDWDEDAQEVIITVE